MTQKSKNADDRALRQFQYVVERYQSLVWAAAYSITGDASLSEDVTQETFLAVWNQQDDIREMKRLKGYLTTIARNQARRALRGVSREQLQGEELLDGVEDSEASAPLDRVLRKEERSLAAAALRDIPEGCREPFVLYYAEGESISRVAESLDLSPAAVKQKLYRARSSLKTSIESVVGQSIVKQRPGKALTAATMALIVAKGGPASAAATASGQQIPAKLSIGTPTKIAAGIALSVAAMFVGQALFWPDTDTSPNPVAARRHVDETSVADTKPFHLNLAGPRSMTRAERVSNEEAQAQGLLKGKMQDRWAAADIDSDGILSEDEVIELRDRQEDELVERIMEHWQDEPCAGSSEAAHSLYGVTCAFVDEDENTEGFIPYALFRARAHYERARDNGLEMNARQWLHGAVASAQDKRVCYEITATPHDEIHRILSEAPGEPLRWIASVHLHGQEPEYLVPPAKLALELKTVSYGHEATDVAQNWGIQLFLDHDDRRLPISPPRVADWASLSPSIRQALESARRPAAD